MKILIADTAKETKAILGRILEDEGYTYCYVENSCDIINRVYNENPDIIFLSTHLSDHCSLRILEKMKSAPSTREVPVILIGTKRAHKTLAKGYQLGAYDYISMPYFKEEVLARLRNIMYIRTKTKELESMMDRDYLTGLYNRKFFMDRMVEELSWSVNYHEPLSLMMLDIDYFKRINDSYGHRCGDEVLGKLAQVLLSTMRKEDVIGRYGGEEFIVLMSNTDSATATASGERVRKAVMDGKFYCDESDLIPVTVSIGVTIFNEIMEISPDVLIGQADSALYAAKEGGRNRVCLFRP
ncbi:MAG: diguanylate cyclase [Nitrospirota bacterium]